MLSFLTLLSLYLISGVYGSIGPAANVFIQNKIIGPDGFNRSYVDPYMLLEVQYL